MATHAAQGHAKAHPHEKPHHPHWPLAGLLFAFVFLLGCFSVHESSTWIHIKTGAKILSERALPANDSFSYTMAGRPWTTTSWLSDVVFCLIHRGFGPQGLVAFKALVAATAFALLVPINPASPLTAVTVLGFGAIASWTGLTEKPAVFDLLMLALLIRILRPRKPFRWTVVLQVAAVELLWANLHGARAMLGVWLVLLKIFKTSMRTTQRERLKYLGVMAAALFALACNPHGLGLIGDTFAGLGTYGAAWRPLSAWLNLYALFALAGLGSCFVVLQEEFLLTINAATLLLYSLVVPAMHCAYVLAACPVIALAVGHFVASKPINALRVARWAALMAFLFWLHWTAVFAPLGRWRGYGVTSLDGALHFLKENGVRGRLFNEAEAGAYLIGGSERAVFIDERTSLYDASFAKDAARWTETLSLVSDVYRCDYALILNNRADYPARIFDADPAWRLAYADDAALVYIRRAGVDGWLVANALPRLAAPNRLFPDALDEPLKQIRLVPRVMSELDRWILEAPGAVQPLIWKAYALDRRGLTDKARWLMEKAEALPAFRHDPELMAAAAFFYAMREDDGRARILYLRAEQIANRRGDGPLHAQISAGMAWLANRRRGGGRSG
ncbi:MAG: hypothetical protein HY077_14800 [Elusimicrobia bacterium]|nr:hypothetical protein [Elusimicrobiota bacterium]